MRKLMRVATLAVAVIVALPGCAALYSAEAIDARVIDAETREPLEGVIVIINWYLNFGMEGQLQATLKLDETVTDNQGKFHFPAWGPEAVPNGVPWRAAMRNGNPEIILFRPGYHWTAVGNDDLRPNVGPGALRRRSDWTGRAIELKRFRGNAKQYSSELGAMLTGVGYGRCGWKKIPRTIVALNAIAEEFDRQNVYSFFPTFQHIEDISEGENCGSVEAFFREFQK